MPPGGAMAAAGPAGGAELPAFFEYAAPRDWKAIDFISDLHLCFASGTPSTGTCSPRTLNFGCHDVMEDGIQMSICID